MANTYHQIYIQAVFAVKYRDAMIDRAWKHELTCVIGNLINEAGCKSLIVNGVEDHLHCLFAMKPTTRISDVMQSAKAKSSKWINETGKYPYRFEWQEGYGSFSYSRSQLDAVYHYIENQEKHHHSETFIDEYVNLLNKFEVDYDDRYIFKEPMDREDEDGEAKSQTDAPD